MSANPTDDLPDFSPQAANRSYARRRAAERGLDPDFVDRLFTRESGYNSSARSNQGAVGVAQTIPGTAARYGLKDPTDARASIDAGLNYLHDLHKRFNGDQRKVAAGYFAGEGDAEAALANPKGNPKTKAYADAIAGPADDLPDFSFGRTAGVTYKTSGGTLPPDLTGEDLDKPQAAPQRKLGPRVPITLDTSAFSEGPKISRQPTGVTIDRSGFQRTPAQEIAQSLASEKPFTPKLRPRAEFTRQRARQLDAGQGEFTRERARQLDQQPAAPSEFNYAESKKREARRLEGPAVSMLTGKPVARAPEIDPASPTLPPPDESFRRAMTPGPMTDVVKSLVQGAVGATLDVPAYFNDISGDTPSVRKVRQILEDIRGAVTTALPIEKPESFWTAQVPQAAGSSVPFMVASALAPEAIAGRVVAGLGAAQNGHQVYDEAIKAGKSHADALRASIYGAAIGTTEMFGLGNVASRAGSMRLLEAIKHEALEEGGQETLQAFLNNATARGFYDPNRPLDQDVIKNAVIGAITGGVMGGGTHAGAEAIGRLRGREAVTQPADIQPSQPQPPLATAAPSSTIHTPPGQPLDPHVVATEVQNEIAIRSGGLPAPVLPPGAGAPGVGPGSEAQAIAPKTHLPQIAASGVADSSISSEAAIQATVPESTQTLQAQLEALREKRGSRKAVLVTPGEEMPASKGALESEGLAATKTRVGVLIHDPRVIARRVVREAAENGTYHELLGIVEPKSAAATEAVVARGADGTEIQAAMASPENIAPQHAELAAQHPQSTIAVERPSDVIASREADRMLEGKPEPFAEVGRYGMKPEHRAMVESDRAAHDAATSPLNDRPEPTEGQKEAGNYKKGHVQIGGLDVSIENPEGSKRKPEWPALKSHYGYLRRTEGADSEQIDAFIKPGTPESYGGPVFVVDQAKKDGSFDEHKVMLGWPDEAGAKAGYAENFTPGWKVGPIRSFANVDEFRSWLKTEDTTKPAVRKGETSPPQYPAESVRGAAARRATSYDRLVALRRAEHDQLFQESLLSAGDLDRVAKKFESLKAEVTARRPIKTVVEEYLRQGGLFDSSELNADQKDLLREMASPQRRAQVKAEQPSLFESRPTVESRIADQESRQVPGVTGGLFGFAQDEGLFAQPRAEASAPKAVETKPEAAIAKPVQQSARASSAPIEDFGEKIGGARKDTAARTGERSSKAEPESQDPGWRKRFSVSQIVASGNPDEVGKWVISDTRKTDWRGQPRKIGSPFASKEAAEKGVELAAVARNHNVYMGRPDAEGNSTYTIWRKVTDRKRVQVVKQEFKTRDEAMKYMADHAVDIIETKTNFGEEILAKPEKVVRSGAERRTGPATKEMFGETFGFRGVEFGNWNNQAERQEVMNHAYDGLHDLADVLGVPPKALSLNGELALAFGARGQGLSGAKAHYERDYGVINLTKMSGAGSLAHEWFHAFDHYLGRQDTKAAAERVKNERGDLVYPAGSRDRDFASHGFSARNSQVREQLRAAYKDLVQTMFSKAEKYVEDTQKAEKFVGASRDALAKRLSDIRDNQYSGLSRQLDTTYRARNTKPASAEQLAEFDRLVEKLIGGEDLKTSWRPTNPGKPAMSRGGMAGRFTNETLDGINTILKAVRGRSGFNAEQRGALDDVRREMSYYQQRVGMLRSASEGETKTKQVPTSYAMGAKEIDQGRASDYWTTEHEMAARAFSAYVEDKAVESGHASDFLSYGSDNKFYRSFDLRPFPEGAEREAINKSFDNLFQVLESKETDRGVALYQADQSDEHRLIAGVIADLSAEGVGDFREAVARFRDEFGPAAEYGEIFEAAWDANKNVKKRGKVTFDDALEPAPGKRPKGGDAESLNLVQYIRSRGGIDMGSMKGEQKQLRESRLRQPGVFNKNGLSWDDMETDLRNAGYLQEGEDIFDALDSAARGEKRHANSADYDDHVEREWRAASQKEFAENSDHSIMARAVDNANDPEYKPWIEAYDRIHENPEAEDFTVFRELSHDLGLSIETINRLIDSASRHDQDQKERAARDEESARRSATIPTDAASFRQGLIDHFGYSDEAAEATTSVADALIATLADEGGRSRESLYGQLLLAHGKGKQAGLEQHNPQTDTPEFKRWFGESKVVDEKGAPLVVYHGTTGDFEEFRPGLNKAKDETGIFFSPDRNIASRYTGYDEVFPSDKIGSVIPVYLKANRLKIVDFKGGKYGRGEAVAKARAEGFDGVLLKNHYDAHGVQDQYVVFSPTQIKSAIGNRGTFDPKNPNILKQTAETGQSQRIGIFDKEGKLIGTASLSEKSDPAKWVEQNYGKGYDFGPLTMNDPRVLRQAALGMTEFLKTGQAVIRALQNPNESTGVHEIHHATLPIFMRLAEEAGVSDQLVRDMSRMAEWMGFDNTAHFNKLHDAYVQGTLKGRNLKAYVEGQEKGARGFEKYLRTGKAPTRALEAVFAKFKEWLTRIYENVKGSAIDIPFTHQQVAIWDRMLGGKGDQGPKVTSIKNAVTEAERSDRGLDPVEKELRRGFGQLLEEGKSLVDENPYFRQTVVVGLIERPRAPSDAEDAALAYDRMKLYNEHRSALREMGEAVERDDATGVFDAERKLAAIESAIDLNDQAAKRSGTESGRSLNARKMMIRADYSLAAMIQKVRAAGAGKEIAPELRKQIEEMAERISFFESKLDARESYITELESRQAQEEKLANWRAAGKKRQPRSKGVLDDELIRMQDHFARLTGGGEPGPGNPERGGLFQKQGRLFQADKINGYEGPFTDEMRKLIKDMARNRVEAGARSAENVNEQVHRIVSQYLPDVEAREVGDVWSEYGKTAKLSMEEIDVAMREAKRQQRLLAALEDAQAGESPLRSGLNRDKRTERVRELTKLVSAEMRKQGVYDTRSPEERWATALEGIKTSLRNSIADMTKRLETGERPAKRVSTPLDAEAQSLKAQRDALAQTLRDIEGPRKLTDQERIQMSERGIEKSIANLDERIKAGQLSPKSRVSMPWSPKIGNLREQRKVLADQLKALRDAAKPVRDKDAAKIKASEQGLQKSIERLDERIKTGDLAAHPRVSAAWSSEISKLQAQRKVLADTLKALRDAAKPPRDKDAALLKAFKKRVEKSAGEYQRRLDEGDYTTTKRKPLELDAEAQVLAQKRDVVKAQYQRQLESMRPGKRWRTLSGLRKAWMLSGVSTQAKNIIGTGAYQLFDEIARMPAAVADVALSAITGQRSASGLSPAAVLDSVVAAMKIGGKEAKEILKHGATAEQMKTHQFGQEIDTGIKAIDVTANAVFRLMSASDRVFYNQSLRRNLLDRATAQARTEARTDKASKLKRRAKDLADNPSPELLASAKHDALVATFNNSNRLSEAIKRGRGALSPGANFALDLVMPFDRTPTNVIARVLEASPYGYARNAKQIARWLIKREMTVEQQREFSQTFGRATAGSAIMALGAYLAAQGVLTGLAPSPGDRKKDKEEGIESNSVKIGSNWVPLGALSPLGTILTIGAGLYRETHRAEANWKVVGTALQPLTDQPLLRGANQAADFLRDPGRGGAGVAGSFAYSFMPTGGLLRDIAKATDPAKRRFPSKEFTATGLKEQIQQNIPIGRQKLPETEEQERIERLVRKLPRPIAKDTREPVDAELDRLGVSLPFPQNEITIDGVQQKIPAPKFDEFRQRIAETLYAQLADMISKPVYRRLGIEDQKLMVKDFKEAWSANERRRLHGQLVGGDEGEKEQEQSDQKSEELEDKDAFIDTRQSARERKAERKLRPRSEIQIGESPQ